MRALSGLDERTVYWSWVLLEEFPVFPAELSNGEVERVVLNKFTADTYLDLMVMVHDRLVEFLRDVMEVQTMAEIASAKVYVLSDDDGHVVKTEDGRPTMYIGCLVLDEGVSVVGKGS